MQQIAGKYTLLRKLAAGGMAEVFLALQQGPEGFEKLVVIKKVLPHLAEDTEFIELFLQEARTAAGLRHPNVVDVYEVTEDAGTYFMAMEFLQGPSLAQLMKECRQAQESMPVGAAIEIVIRAASGLHHAHTKADIRGKSLRIVHRDVSPQNILVTCEGVTKVIDFGIARVAGRASSHSRPGMVRGKVAYMSPEQATGKEMDHRTDLFSLGIILYELTTNRRLFAGVDGAEVIRNVVAGPIARPSAIVEGYPAALETIVMKALERNRDDRYASCQDFAMALEELAEQRGISHSTTRLGQFVRSLFHESIDASAPLLQTISSGRRTALEPAALGQADSDQRERRQPSEASLPPREIGADHVPTKAFPVVAANDATTVSPSSGSGASEFEGFLDAIGRYLLAEPRQRKSSVPVRLDSFVGRSSELSTLETLLAAGQRLITLHGPPGIGKTRLAIALTRWKEEEANSPKGSWRGAFFVDLSEARSAEGICYALAQALDVRLLAGTTTADAVVQLSAQIAQHGHALFVFDGFDVVFEHAPATLGRWLAAAPEASFVVTSRDPLGLAFESAHRVGPLALPVDGKDVAHSDAAQLFVERARAVRPGYSPRDGAEWQGLAELVQQLDGVPLVIELAAARMMFPNMTPRSLLGWLPRRYDLVSDGTDSRSSVVGDAVAWSWKLLSAHEQSVLASLSVVRGGFSVAEAAQLIDWFADSAASPAAAVLQALREKALLRFYLPPLRPDDLRLDMYEPVRAHATRMLEETGKRDEAVSRHAAWCRARGGEWALAAEGPGATEALDHLTLELDNLVAGFQRSHARNDADGGALAADLALAIHPVLEMRGPFGPHLSILDSAIESAEKFELDSQVRARLLLGRGTARRLRGLVPESIADLQRAKSHAERANDTMLVGRVLWGLGASHFRKGDLEAARTQFRESLELATRTGDRWYEGRGLFFLGNLEFACRRHDEAANALGRALEATRRSGDRLFEARTLGHQGLLAAESGDVDRAEDQLEETVARLRELGNARLVGFYLGKLACLRYERGRLQEARVLLDKAVAQVRESGDTRLEAVLTATRAGVLALVADFDASREGFDVALNLVSKLGDPLSTMAVGVHRVLFDLAFARESSSPVTRQAGLDAARARMAAAEAPGSEGSAADRSDDVRFALRIARRVEAGVFPQRGAT